MHYCYIMKAGTFVKIGYTNDPNKRLECIQTCCPYEVSIVGLFPYLTELAARDMEKSLHKRFEKFRVRGEWYKSIKVLGFLRKSNQIEPSLSKEKSVQYSGGRA